jgi:predicted DCC family thiol-disulfide oxidoreductase YuxK
MSVATITTPATLTVCYDEQCALCRRCRDWLEGQRTLVRVEFLASGSRETWERYGDVPWLGADLVVVDEHGNVWAGPAAFLMCLWATEQYRAWAYRLSGKALAPMAEWFFHFVSSNRRRIGAVVGTKDCPDGRCGHRAAPATGQAAPPPAQQQPPLTYAPPALRCAYCGAAGLEPGKPCWNCGAGR